MIKRIIAFAISFFLVFEQSGFAQVAGGMHIPGYMANIMPPEIFNPVQLRAISFDPAAEKLSLFLDKGDTKLSPATDGQSPAAELYKYFQIGLRLPNSVFWVNLRPDAPQDIIDPYLEKTDVGRILLAADLQLKKDLALFTSPDRAEGKRYWDKLYAKAEELYGQADVEIPTMTRPWIVPGEVIIRESNDGAYIYKAGLRVMLEQDYLKDSPFFAIADPKLKEMNAYSSELLRFEILPKLTREINAAKRYAPLRQVYYSLVLAQWFKQKNKDQANAYARTIDSKDVTGLTAQTAWSKDTYFNDYKTSFSQGEYKKEEQVTTSSGIAIRSYFSGGVQLDGGSLTFKIFADAGIDKFFNLVDETAGVSGVDVKYISNQDGGTPTQSNDSENSDNDLKKMAEQNKEIYFVSTQNANYILNEKDVHPTVPDEMFNKIDGAVLGSELDTFASGKWFHHFDFTKYDHFDGDLTAKFERSRKALFYADMPMHELFREWDPAALTVLVEGATAVETAV